MSLGTATWQDQAFNSHCSQLKAASSSLDKTTRFICRNQTGIVGPTHCYRKVDKERVENAYMWCDVQEEMRRRIVGSLQVETKGPKNKGDVMLGNYCRSSKSGGVSRRGYF